MNSDVKNENWYQDWFGQDYVKVYPHRDEKEARQHVDFVIRALGLKKNQHILDLGCGGGRHAIRLSGLGYNTTCLDLSSVLLEIAKNKKYDKCCIRFVKADMRKMPFTNTFDALVSFFTTFGYFKTDDENLKTLKSIESVLKPGGVFFQDYLNKTYVIENLVPFDSKKMQGYEIIQERFYNKKDERIEKKISLIENGKTRNYFESVRLYTLEEMKNLLKKTSLTLQATYGDFDGSDFLENSPRLLLTGRKEASV